MFEGCKNHTFDSDETWTWKCLRVCYFSCNTDKDLYQFILQIGDCDAKSCYLRKNETCNDFCGNEEGGIKLLNDGTSYPRLKVCVICEECGSCQSACQTSCEVSCESECEASCQTYCETVCQTGCEVACQTTCQITSQFCGRECGRGLNR